MKEKYKSNIIDIDKYTTPEYFRDNLIKDMGGHPSRDGYLLFSKMVAENTSPL